MENNQKHYEAEEKMKELFDSADETEPADEVSEPPADENEAPEPPADEVPEPPAVEVPDVKIPAL